MREREERQTDRQTEIRKRTHIAAPERLCVIYKVTHVEL